MFNCKLILAIGLSAGMFLLAGCGILDELPGNDSSGPLSSTTGQSPDLEAGDSESNPIRISAKDLVREYERNRHRFSYNYVNKWLQVDGKVMGVRHQTVIVEEFTVKDDAELFSGKAEGKLAFEEHLSFHSQSRGLFQATAGERITVICRLVEVAGYGFSASYELVGCFMPNESESI